MTLVNIVAYDSDGTTPLVNLSTASGVRLRSIGRPAVRYRVKTVEFDDVPDETTVSVVRAATDLSFGVGADAATLGAATDYLDDLTDILCDPDLRTWYVELVYDDGREERWTCLRPADAQAVALEGNAPAKWIETVYTCRVKGTPTITPAA